MIFFFIMDMKFKDALDFTEQASPLIDPNTFIRINWHDQSSMV